MRAGPAQVLSGPGTQTPHGGCWDPSSRQGEGAQRRDESCQDRTLRPGPGHGVLIVPPPPPPPPQASTSLFLPRCGLSAQKLGWDPGPPLPAWPVTAHKTSCLWVGPPPQEGQPGGPQGAPPHRADRGGGLGGQCGAVGSHPVAGGGLDHTRLGELGQWLDLRPLSLQRQPLLAREAWAELISPSSRPPRSPHGPRPSGDLSLRPPAVRCPF